MAKGRPPKTSRKADNRPERAIAIPNASITRIIPMPPTVPADAQDIWDMVCAGLPGIATSDIGDVEICVTSIYEYRAFSQILNDNGYLQVAENEETGEKVVCVPAAVVKIHKMRATAANTYRYHADRLGLSRMARARLNLLDLAGKSELVGLAERVNSLRE